MTTVEIGINDIDNADDGLKLVEMGQNNYDGPDEINESGGDRVFRTVYYEEGTLPEEGTDTASYTPKWTEIRMWPKDGTTATFLDPEPLTDSYDGLPGEVEVGIGVGYGPVEAGVGYGIPVSHDPDHKTLTSKDGDFWNINADESIYDLKGPEWPVGPADPSSGDLIDEVPTAEVDVHPDEWLENDEYRGIVTEAQFHYTVSSGQVVYDETSDTITSTQYYHVANDS